MVFGNTAFAIGDKVSVGTDLIVDITSASATTFAAGATVNFNTSTKLAVATGGVGAGVAMAAKIDGQTVVRTRLNRIKVTAAS